MILLLKDSSPRWPPFERAGGNAPAISPLSGVSEKRVLFSNASEKIFWRNQMDYVS